MRDLVFLALFIGALVVAINRIQICILLWAWVALLAPNFLLYGIAGMVSYNKIVAAMVVLALAGCHERKGFYGDRTSAFVVFFLCIAALSQFMSEASDPGGWEILDKLWKIVALNLLVTSFMRSRIRLHALVLTLCVATGFAVAGAGLKFLVSAGQYHEAGISGWGDNNHVALIALMLMPMLAYVREVSAAAATRLGAVAGIGLYACCVVSTNSRGGFIGLILLAAIGIARSRQKVGYFLAIATLGVALSQVVPESWTNRMNTIETAQEDGSFMGRVKAWKMSTLIALESPMLGGGLHAVTSQNIWSAHRPDFYKLSFIETDEPDITPHAAHSIYFEVLGDTGFVGLAVFLAILASSVWSGFQVKTLARGHPELVWATSLAGKLQLSLLVLATTGAALSASYNDLNFIIFAMLSAVRQTVWTEINSRKLAVVRGMDGRRPLLSSYPPRRAVSEERLPPI